MTIDIMMPFYGSPDDLKTAVTSVLNQSDPRWRLTVIDDQYPDPEPGAWCAAIEDERVTYLRNETNLGVAGNFQRSAELLSSEFGVIMGCDDVMLPGYIGRMHELVERFPAASFIQPGVDVIDETGAPALPMADRIKRLCRLRGEHPAIYAGETPARSLAVGDWSYFPSICWRSELLTRYGFRADYEVTLDLAMKMDILLDGGSLLLDDEVVFHYRRHSASVSSDQAVNGKRFLEEKRFYTELADRFHARGWSRARRSARARITSRLNAGFQLPGAIARGRTEGARILLRHALGR